VPALGVALALVEVRDQQVCDSVPVVVGDQRPLCVGFLWRQRVVRAEQARELPAEPPLAGQPCRERTEWAVQQFLNRPQAGAAQDHAAVAQHHPLKFEWQAALKVSGQQLGGDRRAHVVRDEHDWPGCSEAMTVCTMSACPSRL